MVLTTKGSHPDRQPDDVSSNPRSEGLPDPYTQALLDKIGTPKAAVKAGAKSGRKGK
jgi:hypothetical protein